MFADVLKKFFTLSGEFENKEATETSKQGTPAMLSELKAVLTRSSDTLVQDAAGAAALVVMLIVSLHLPGLV
jgi:hypothetical protein